MTRGGRRPAGEIILGDRQALGMLGYFSSGTRVDLSVKPTLSSVLRSSVVVCEDAHVDYYLAPACGERLFKLTLRPRVGLLSSKIY